jgi:hypothetical protein
MALALAIGVGIPPPRGRSPQGRLLEAFRIEILEEPERDLERCVNSRLTNSGNDILSRLIYIYPDVKRCHKLEDEIPSSPTIAQAIYELYRRKQPTFQ